MNARARSRNAASIGSNQPSNRATPASASGCTASGFVVGLAMAWSPARRASTGLVRVGQPGDYATPNSNQPRDGTAAGMTTGPPSAPLRLAVAIGAAALQLAALAPAWAGGGGPCAGCFAVVRGDGSLDRGAFVLSTARLGPGRYRVEFQGRVDACALATTIGNGGSFTAPTGSGTGGRAAPPLVTSANVATFDVRGRPADRTFHLVVTC